MKDHVLKACRLMLAPIMRLLIRSGVSWAEFSELGKEIYVDVARQDYGLQGRPTNASRVALMTGLSRREVMRINKLLEGQSEAIPAALSRISQVLSGWHLDQQFLDKDGKPAVLPQEGDESTIATLFDCYAGDTPHGALLKEMLQLGLVVKEPSGYRVTARDYIRSAADPGMLHQAAIALHDHANTVLHNVNTDRQGPPRFERMASCIDVDLNKAERFQQLLNDKGQAFLEDMDRWLSETHPPATKTKQKRKSLRAGVGVYLILEDVKEETEDENK